jgi:hypothetical protein
MSVKITGLDEFERKMKKMGEDMGKCGGQIPLPKLMSPAFIKECTSNAFDDVEKLFAAYPSDPHGDEETKAMLESPEWNQFIASNTTFGTWQDMVNEAAREYMQGQVNEVIRKASR